MKFSGIKAMWDMDMFVVLPTITIARNLTTLFYRIFSIDFHFLGLHVMIRWSEEMPLIDWETVDDEVVLDDDTNR